MIRSLYFAVLAMVAVAVGVMTYQWTSQQSGEAPYGGPFVLTSASTGDEVDETALQGQPTAMFFGFTHCPDVCPTTLYEMDGWFRDLGSDAEDIKGVFVTVDPERDDAETLGRYVANVTDRVEAWTGTPEQVQQIVREFNIYARKVPTEGGDYTMDHSAMVILLDSGGRFFGTIAYGENPDTAKEKLRRLADA